MDNLLFTFTQKNISEFLVEQQVKRNEQRAKNNEQRAKRNEQRAKIFTSYVLYQYVCVRIKFVDFY